MIFYHLTDLDIFGESGLTAGIKQVPPLFPNIHTRDGDWTLFGFPPWVWLTTDAETIPHEDGCTLVCLTIDIPSSDRRLKSAKTVFDQIKDKTPWPETIKRAGQTFWTYEGIIHPSAYTEVKVVEGGRRKPWWLT
jgi:hypothetical protein